MTEAAAATDPISLSVGGAKVSIATEAVPSDSLKASARKEVIVEDELGRNIKLRKPGVLDQFHLIEALGETAKNEVYMAMTLPLLFIASIDGVPVAPPRNKTQLEATIKRLDEEGIQAVMKGVTDNFGLSTEDETKNA